MKIGIFDSGSGGMTTLRAIRSILPNEEYYYIADIEHRPYGDKAEKELQEITAGVTRKLADWGAEIVVIACNTATTRCIHDLRKRFPSILFVGTEPALKVATDAGCQNIALLATPSTTTSQQVKRLIARNVSSQKVFLVPCEGLAATIEDNIADITEMKLRPGQKIPNMELANQKNILRQIDMLSQNLADRNSIDGVVLGCTHYVLIKNLITAVFPKAKLFDGNLGVARRLKALLTERGKASV